jgi:hypothetical protein
MVIWSFCSINRSAAGLANLMPWLAEFPGDPLNCKKMISNADKVYEFIEDIIEEHVNEFDENEIDDLTSAYIKELRFKESTGEETTMSCKVIYICICIYTVYVIV